MSSSNISQQSLSGPHTAGADDEDSAKSSKQNSRKSSSVVAPYQGKYKI